MVVGQTQIQLNEAKDQQRLIRFEISRLVLSAAEVSRKLRWGRNREQSSCYGFAMVVGQTQIQLNEAKDQRRLIRFGILVVGGENNISQRPIYFLIKRIESPLQGI